jgi:hypothetical protein
VQRATIALRLVRGELNMYKLQIMRDGFEIARLPCSREVCIWNLAVTLEKAGRMLASFGRVAIWIENGNVSHFIGVWED